MRVSTMLELSAVDLDGLAEALEEHSDVLRWFIDPKVFSVMLPGVEFFSTRTARKFACPAWRLPATSKRFLVNAPSIRPSLRPLRKTFAFQSMPSKLSHTCLPGSTLGPMNSSRYQKSE